ncbi:MAG: hypothetical protein KKB20_11450 [Proteobacteria bacterium]|nr:hypothetical protein [Pseudomonadota bacterium]
MTRPSQHPELEALRGQVLANCHRSDARYAGSFSLCGLLLRLRDYYKWEHDLAPWAEVDSPEVLGWVDERETLWESIQGQEPADLVWRGRRVNPFETEVLNQDLAELGFYYGAGYAAFLKPSFFLARVLDEYEMDGFRVTYLDDEIARDLFTVPAQILGREIVARIRPLAAYFWDSILYAGAWRRTAWSLALAAHGLARDDLTGPAEEWAPRFREMLIEEMAAFVWHEYGEATEPTLSRTRWRALVGANPYSRIELLARTLKDLLADVGDQGRLRFIITNRRVGSLGIYVAQLDGLAARLFPEIGPAFDRFLKEQDWEDMEAARSRAWKRVSGLGRDLMDLAEKSADRPGDWLAARVEEVFYQPLGL